MIRWSKLCFVLALVAAFSNLARADWDESVDGDLSTDPLAPTALLFGLGDNFVTGTVQTSGDTRDYFTFNVANGFELTGIFLLDYTDVASGGTGNRGFIHIDDGTSSVIPSGATISDFLGGSHLDRTIFPNATDNVLLTLAGAPQGGTGFAAPLGSGDYTINVQQTGPQLTGYSLNVVIERIPEPGAGILLATLGTCLLAKRRRV